MPSSPWTKVPTRGAMARVTLVNVAWIAMLIVLCSSLVDASREPRMATVIPAVKKPVIGCIKVIIVRFGEKRYNMGVKPMPKAAKVTASL